MPRDVADEEVPLGEFVQAGFEVRADALGVALDVVAVDDVEGGEPLRHRDGVAAEGVEVDPVLHGPGDFGAGDAGAQRSAVADPLGHGHEVGGDSPVLEAPEMLAGPAETGLDLVGDAKAAGLADDIVDDPEVFGGRGDDAADPWIGSPMKAATSPEVS